jgi:hypothetical protein
MSEEILSSTPAEATPSAPATAPATPGTTAPVAATPATPQVNATVDDRSNWVPPHRIRESREAAYREASQKASQEIQAARDEARRYQQQVLALTGVTPPQNPEIQAVRDQFGGLYPGLTKLEAKAAQLEALLERAGDLESQTDHYWQSYGRQTMDRVFELAEKSLGSPLNDEGKRQLHSSFMGFVQSSPELSARYANDPSIVNDFWNAFTSTFIDPARRAASATVAGRAAQVAGLPVDSPSGSVATSQPPKFSSLDERAAAGWNQYKQGR